MNTSRPVFPSSNDEIPEEILCQSFKQTGKGMLAVFPHLSNSLPSGLSMNQAACFLTVINVKVC